MPSAITVPSLQSLQLGQAGSPVNAVADLVDAIGTDRFGATLLNHLHDICAADYCAVFRVGASGPNAVITGSRDGSEEALGRANQYVERGVWSRDPSMQYAQKQLPGRAPMLMKMDVSTLAAPEDREIIWPRIRDRVVVAGRSGPHTFSLSVLREGRGGFTPAQVERIGASAELLISAVAKHGEVVPSGRVSGVISSLANIERCIEADSLLTPRESQVCARILYGLTTTGIALDLGVSNETVKTLRKLAYRRLAIGSERELLQWYLALWERAACC